MVRQRQLMIKSGQLAQLILLPGGTGLDSLRLRYSKPLVLLLALSLDSGDRLCQYRQSSAGARHRAAARDGGPDVAGCGAVARVRQLLTESILLASLGGALELRLLCGRSRSHLILANGRENFTLRAGLNWHVLAVQWRCLSSAGFVRSGAAIQATRVDVMPALKNGPRQRARSEARLRFLIAAQLRIALLVLVAAGLFTRTLSNLNAIQLGSIARTSCCSRSMRSSRHRNPEIADFYRNLQTQFQAIPGVRNATLSKLSIMAGGGMILPLKVHGEPVDITKALVVGPSFFTTMQIPILMGHDLEDRGRAAAVVDEEFAKTYFPGENPVGQHIAAPHYVEDVEIVGVSANAKYGTSGANQGAGSLPPIQPRFAPAIAEMVFELRTAGNPLTYASTVRELFERPIRAFRFRISKRKPRKSTSASIRKRSSRGYRLCSRSWLWRLPAWACMES